MEARGEQSRGRRGKEGERREKEGKGEKINNHSSVCLRYGDIDDVIFKVTAVSATSGGHKATLTGRFHFQHRVSYWCSIVTTQQGAENKEKKHKKKKILCYNAGIKDEAVEGRHRSAEIETPKPRRRRGVEAP